ncbi:zinc dependent phospholipase C family protein [Ruminococcus sp. Marseille-P6503]|uniref:zinc dependent phospholipase C family protein n=1 Tax=Ruminococcus sp. Marseille-P6503 TaxID=2364796 RepID=UPI000F548BDF|nr:zinc dependent phospholipase C family protein [Ruminococcus sp. Marseille-P6503]
MPSVCVHLMTACILKDRLDIISESDFYLGSIAPDAVNLNGFAEERVRYAAHLRSKDYGAWKKNIADYYKSAANRRGDFLKGFFLHLYTDIAWDEIIQPGLFDYLKASGYSDSELNSQKWKELSRFDSQLRSDARYKQIIKKLPEAQCRAVSSVSAAQLDNFRALTVKAKESDKQSEAPRYLSFKAIADTAELAYGYIKDLYGS